MTRIEYACNKITSTNAVRNCLTSRANDGDVCNVTTAARTTAACSTNRDGVNNSRTCDIDSIAILDHLPTRGGRSELVFEAASGGTDPAAVPSGINTHLDGGGRTAS